MAGRIIRILERTDFEYSNLGVSSSTGEISLGDVDVSGSRETTLLIRVHALNLASGSGTPKYSVIVKATAPTTEDPTHVFRDPTALVTSVITTGSTVPFLVRAAVPANCGAWISVLLQATQGGSVDTLTATLSIDASLKE